MKAQVKCVPNPYLINNNASFLSEHEIVCENMLAKNTVCVIEVDKLNVPVFKYNYYLFDFRLETILDIVKAT
jgi:hypothetical protein